ncbi:hypothetical protein TWF696_009050 [Orbilia brochopaga]|uniref:Uncharacterized protein n=1 Tax=Orbilia brochopaga TaxID=3140254 RepID=A0AAV9UET2_9PEZI
MTPTRRTSLPSPTASSTAGSSTSAKLGDTHLPMEPAQSLRSTSSSRSWSVLNGTAPEQTKALYEVRFDHSPPTVNCFDQTGILGLCLYFACKEEADLVSLTPYFMAPFGFLRDTPLVGWDKEKDGASCNNPFDSYSYELHVEPTAAERSYFGSHVFLGFRDRIYDACAGPYIGQGDLNTYIGDTIDRKEGRYPPKIRHNNDVTDLKTVDLSGITGTEKNARGSWPATKHGGILGELDSMMRKTRWKLPSQISDHLNRGYFKLDAHNVGPFLKDSATKSNNCTILSVTGPDGESGALGITTDPSEQGEYTWTIKAKWRADEDHPWSEGTVTLLWRILPDFESAVAERAGMYDYGNMKDGPGEPNLADDVTVSAHIDATNLKPKKNLATAVVKRNLLHVQTNQLYQSATVQILEDVLKCASYAYQSDVQMRISGPRSGSEKTPTVFYTKVGAETTYLVRTRNCFDIDWSYTTGNIFLLECNRDVKVLRPNEMISMEGETDLEWLGDPKTKIYRFRFHGRSAGKDTVRLVFYDRYYLDTYQYRYLHFDIR